MNTYVFKVTVKSEASVHAVEDILAGYLESSESPFRSDYAEPVKGEQRADGYAGPYIRSVEVRAW